MRANRSWPGVLLLVFGAVLLWSCSAHASNSSVSVTLLTPGPTPATSMLAPTSTPPPTAGNRVATENALRGTSSWQITDPAVDGEIAGYAGATSYDRGRTVDLHISTRTGGEPYTIELYRMGWYGGAGARLVKAIEGLKGEAQGYWSPGEGLHDCSRCKMDEKTGLVEANWSTTYRLKLDEAWPSGVYLAKLQTANGKQAFVPIVVRDDSRRGALLVQVSVNTWQAYNAWGDHSLYGSFDNSRKWTGKDGRAYKVSFGRPYDPTESDQPAQGAGEFLFWEYDFTRWAEAQGYDLTYATDVDLHAHSDLLRGRPGFASVGHDEYWSWQQRDQVEAARDAGAGLAFFGGNDVYWQVRFEQGSDGSPNQTMVCYKDAALDPVAKKDAKRTTVEWAEQPVDRPQSFLTGTTYGTNATPRQQDWTVADGSSWIFSGSGLSTGDTVPGIVGYEYDRPAAPDARPNGLDVVGLSTVKGWNGFDSSASVVYQGKSGAPVFSAGTIQWPWALDDFGHESIGSFAHLGLQIVTKNILDAMIAPAR